MKRITTVFGYALLILISLTLSSCFIFRKNKSVTKSTTDSTAYNKIESSLQQHQQEAWNNYLNKQDSSSTGITFYNVGHSHVKFNADGSIEASGGIQSIFGRTGTVTKVQETGNRQSKVDYKYVNTKYDIVRTITITKTKDKKPDVKAIAVTICIISLVLALVSLVINKRLWFVKLWAKVVDWLKGFFTGI